MVEDDTADTLPVAAGPPSSRSGPPRVADPRYVLRGLLGRGGMGEIWLAEDTRIGREVAIKLMRGDSAHDPEAAARFLREARVQGRLEHPAIVPVHDLGSDPGAPYFAMKRLAGTTLADVLDAQAEGAADALARWPRRTLLARLVDACLAIELAHQRGVIHRDLKPANLMLGDFGETYVLDWGLARVGDAREAPIRAGDLGGEPGASGHTVAGALMGTPGYMAPEQVRGELVDHRADVYALGAMLFEILAGEPAVPRDTALEATLAADCHRPAARRPELEIAPELDDLCARATASEPADRLGSARELADAIQRYLDGDRDLARRRELAAEHARAAEAHYHAAGEAARAAAMRDAGRAIALDPTNAAAQQLLAQLLLEPPRETPAEARREIERDRELASRAVLRKGVLGYGVNIALIPVAKLVGVAGTWPFLVLGWLLALLTIACWVGARRARPLSKAEIWAIIGLHGVLLATTAVFLGPLVFAPIFAFGSLPVLLMFPGARMPHVVLALHLLVVSVPIGLELAGILPSTFTVSGDALVLHPWAIAAPASVVVALLLAVIVLQMFANTTIFTGQRDAQERAQERVHVTSWHLRQLVR